MLGTRPGLSRPCAAMLLAIALAAAPAALSAATLATPLPPLTAWHVAADGGVYVLDAAQRVYALDPSTLAPLRSSPRLGQGLSGAAAQIETAGSRLFVLGARIDGVQVLNRATLAVVDTLDLDAIAVAAEPDAGAGREAAGGRLFAVVRAAQPQLGGLSRFEVVTLPLDDLQAEPQPFGPTAAQPFSSLFDVAVAADQQLLYVGVADTSGSPNRAYRTYRAYDLQSGAEVELPIARQSTSAAARPVPAGDGRTAIAYDWLGFEPPEHRIYFVARAEEAATAVQTLEGLSGPLAFDESGNWLYLVRPRGLWVLQQAASAAAGTQATPGEYTLQAVIPWLDEAPDGIEIAPGGETLYLFGSGWLSALATGELQSAGVEPFGPFPSRWLGQGGGGQQMARQYRALAIDGVTATAGSDTSSEIRLLNLLPSGEWYRSEDGGRTWQMLAALQYPIDAELDRLSLSPTLNTDGIVAGRGGWQEDFTRTSLRSQDGGATWAPWTPPIAYAVGSEGARTLYVADADGANPRPIPNGGSSENPAWSPGWTHLAFQNNRTGDGEIYGIPAECGELPAGPSEAADVACEAVQLTDSAGDDLLPAWSPDGTQIAFVSLRDGNPEIYIMAADGTQQTRLTFHAGGDWRPAWLPDSRHLVFTSDRYGNNDIFLLTVPAPLAAGGTAEPPLTPVVAGPADQRDPTVNGDNEMVFLAGPPGLQPYTANLTPYLEAERSGGTDAAADLPPDAGTPLFDNGSTESAQEFGHPGWLPDGRLLFAWDGGIYAAAPFTGLTEAEELVAPSAGAVHPAGGPPWYVPPLTAYLPGTPPR